LKVYAGHEGGMDHHGGKRDGLAADASFHTSTKLCLMRDGSIVVGDRGSHLLRMITVTPSGMKFVNTIAGDGTRGHRDGEASQAQFTSILSTIYNPVDDSMWINDGYTRVRKYKDGVVSTVAGDGTQGYRDGPALQAQFRNIHGLGVLGDGSIIVGDFTCVRKISLDGVVSTIAGRYGQVGIVDGEGGDARFRNIWGLLVDANDIIYLSDVTSETGVFSTAVRKLTKSGSSYVTSTLVPTTAEIMAGYLSSFTMEGDLIMRESAVAAMECHGKVHVVKTGCPLPPHLQKLYHKEPHPSDILLENMVKEKGDLFDNAASNYPDITFVVDGRSIPAHRGVLAAGSEYFRLQFISPLQAGDSSTTEVKETTYEALRTVLKYIYTKSHRDVLTFDNVLDVYELSDKYLLSDLQKQCEWYMQSSSNLESTVKWYIACMGRAGCEEVKVMLEGNLVKNAVTLTERHPDLIDELDREGIC